MLLARSSWVCRGAWGEGYPCTAQSPGLGSPEPEKKELDRVHSKHVAFRSQGQPSRPPPGLRGFGEARI